jgi:hypothetical protein
MDPYPDGDEQMTEADDFEEPNSDDTEVYDDSGAKMSVSCLQACSRILLTL